MNITLHQATEQVRAMLDLIDPDTGEMPQQYEWAAAIVRERATAVTAYLLEAERQADAADDYVKDLQKRIKSARKRCEWLRGYLAEHMLAAGIERISDERGLFSARLERDRDRAVEVFDAAQLPEEFLRRKPAPPPEPDKAGIKKAIEAGREVPGAKIVAHHRLTIK